MQILNYIVADARPLPLGGGVTTNSAHHPIALVSPTFRSICLDHPYSTSTKGKATAPVKLSISEALEFSDLRTMATFFEDGPSWDAKTLHNIRFLSISYLDDHAATGWGRSTTNYAYEAFEYLHKHWKFDANILASTLPPLLTLDILRWRPGVMEPLRDFVTFLIWLSLAHTVVSHLKSINFVFFFFF
jgi:hypothetical protein